MSANSANPDTLVSVKPATTKIDTIWPDSTAAISKEKGLEDPVIDPVGGLVGIARGIAKKGVMQVIKEVVDSARED